MTGFLSLHLRPGLSSWLKAQLGSAAAGIWRLKQQHMGALSLFYLSHPHCSNIGKNISSKQIINKHNYPAIVRVTFKSR